MMIDTHSHIYDKQFDIDREQTIQRSIDSGVTRFIVPSVDSSTHEKMFEVVERFKHHYPALGVHPTSIKEDYQDELSLVKELLKIKRSSIVAIGEVGLDLYWDKTFIEEQKKALCIQFDLALENNLPAIVHTRDAFEDMLNIVNDYKGTPLRILFHGYSGTIVEAEKILSMGDHLLGIGGVVTFKKSELGSVVKAVGIDKITLETDAPYLTPMPHRGKRNESSYIPLIASHIAQVVGCSLEEVAKVTTNNAKFFFGIK